MAKLFTIYDSKTNEEIITIDFQEFIPQKFKVVEKGPEGLEPGEMTVVLDEEYKKFKGYSIGRDTIGYFCADRRKKKRTKSYPTIDEVKFDELETD